MKIVRIAVLVLAVAAAGGAVMIAMGPKPAPVQVAALAPPPPSSATDDILVAAKELPLGAVATADDFSWQAWPKDAVAGFMIKRDSKVIADLTGSIVRSDFYTGEPIRRERLIKAANSAGVLAAILPSGMRAVAITIDAQGSTSAGNFVHPNDRVDVVRTVKSNSANASGTDFTTDTLLPNIRVLAIGPNIQDKNGETVVVGATATLEVNPEQAEMIIQAQRTGQLSLTLRSMLDASQANDAVRVADVKTTIIRFGVETDGGPH